MASEAEVAAKERLQRLSRDAKETMHNGFGYSGATRVQPCDIDAIDTVLQALQDAQAMIGLLDRLDAEGWPFWDFGICRLHDEYRAGAEQSGRPGGYTTEVRGATWREAVQALTAQLALGEGGEAHG